MEKFNTKADLKVDGKMSEKGADKAGLIIAIAVLVIATGVAVSAVLWAAHAYFS
ncbi:TPA: hypothetical protein ACIBS5_003780 [Salmonella enterica subsp. diarizonae serovar 60-67:z35:-]